MHICFLNEFFYPDLDGGTPKAMSDLALQLRRKHGDKITVVTSRNSYRNPEARYPESESWEKIDIKRVSGPHWTNRSLPKRVVGNLLFTASAARKLKSVDADVVFVSTAPPTLPLAAMVYLKRKGIPFVYIVYDLEPDRAVALGVAGLSSLPVRIFRRFQQEWMKKAARVVVIGRCMERHVSEVYAIPSDRIDVIEVGADPETVRPKAKLETCFRAKHDLFGFLLIYTGNFGKSHDFDSILEAAKVLSTSAPDVSFILVGRGAKRNYIEKRVEAEKIDNVRVFDFVPDSEYADLLASADVCMVTLEAGAEGLCVPSKFYSVLAAGRPTLAMMNPECEVAYTIREADCGVQIGLTDPKAIENAVLMLKSDPTRLETMGQNARQVFDAKYSSPLIADKLHHSLKRALVSDVTSEDHRKGLLLNKQASR